MSSVSYDSASVPSLDLALLQNHEFASGSFHESQEERKIMDSNQSQSPHNEMEIEVWFVSKLYALLLFLYFFKKPFFFILKFFFLGIIALFLRKIFKKNLVFYLLL